MPIHSFSKDGYLISKKIFSQNELEEIKQVIHAPNKNNTSIWDKELAASSGNFYHLATHPKIVDQVKKCLGENIIVWGTSYLQRKPGQLHPWHTDIESSHPDGGFVTVWIGIDGTNQASALKLLPGSHLFQSTLQENIQQHGRTRDNTTDQDVINWASDLAGSTQTIEQADVTNGDAIFFDGRLWHGSSNDNSDLTRHALLIQYARPDCSVRLPDFRQLDWPFKFLDHPKPPCVKVSGDCTSDHNNLVDKPPVITADSPILDSTVHPIDLDKPIDPVKKITQTPLLRGHSPNMQQMAAHYSVLDSDHSPHPPHAHVDEEVLIILKGEAELHYCDGQGNVTPHQVRAGDAVYYPAFHRHTIYNNSDNPVVYLMFKWIASGANTGDQALQLQRFGLNSASKNTESGNPFQSHDFFTQSSTHLNRLHSHLTTLLPGGGYDEHIDEHDVALIVFEGQIKVLNQTVNPGELVWLTAGDSHGMLNPGTEPARYLVLEFHGSNCADNFATFGKRRKKKLSGLFKKRSPDRILKNFRRALGLKK